MRSFYLICHFAFDRVWQDELTARLPTFGIEPELFTQINVFLCSRSITVRVGLSDYDFFDLNPGVPQSSVLAPILFLVFADYGDLCEDELDEKDDPTFLPTRLLRLIPGQILPQIQSNQNLAQKLKECYKSYKGITRDRAELQYLKIAQAHHLFGVDFFPIVCVRMKCPRALSLARYLTRNELTAWRGWDKHHTNAWLGVTAAGLQLYGKNQRERPRYTFQWNIIKNVSYRERKFTIKLIASWDCPGKTSHSSCVVSSSSTVPVTSTELISGTQQRPRQSSRSTGGRSPLIGAGGPTITNLTVASGLCSSGISAGSLPSTPLSARLTLLAPSPMGTSGLGASSNLTASPRTQRDASCERTIQHRGHSPTVIKNSAKIFDFDSGCIPGLNPILSRCSASELPILGGVGCLATPRIQTTDSSGAASSSSSKSSFLPLCRRPSGPLISVVEVWLADPSQAKTVMSMCAGNHALFMRRRQPDSVEVQQMRAQAREERARREIERSRLARARAEKAEAMEAKLALETRCAQLEQALRRQQELQRAYFPDGLSGNEGMLGKDGDKVDREPGVSTSQPHLTSHHGPHYPLPARDQGNEQRAYSAPEESQLPTCAQPQEESNVDDEGEEEEEEEEIGCDQSGDRLPSNRQFGECIFYPPEEIPENGDLDYTECMWRAIPDEQRLHPSGYRNQVYPQHFPASVYPIRRHSSVKYKSGSASTPATPFARRAYLGTAESGLNNQFDHHPLVDGIPRNFPPLAYSTKCVQHPGFCRSAGCALCDRHGLRSMGSSRNAIPADPRLFCDYPMYVYDNHLPVINGPHVCANARGSLPVLHSGICTCGESVAPGYPAPDPWAYQEQALPPTVTNNFPPYHPYGSFCPHPSHPSYAPAFAESNGPAEPHVYHQLPPDPVNRWRAHQNSSEGPPNNPSQLSTSMSAILSPVAGQRWRQLQAQKQQRQGGRHSQLERQQEQIGLLEPLTSINSRPFGPLVRTTSQIQLTPSGAHQTYSGNEFMPRWSQPDDLYHGHSLQQITALPQPPTEINRHTDLYMGSPEMGMVPPYTIPTDSQILRRAASITCTPWTKDPVPMARVPAYGEASYPEQLCLPSSQLNPSRRGYLTCRLQEERARFALLQAQFSKQLSDTWACLEVTRSPLGLKASNLYGPSLKDPTAQSEMRHDPAGASDGASTGGGVGAAGRAQRGSTVQAPGGYMSLDQLTSGLMAEPQQLLRTNWERSESTAEETSTDGLRTQEQFILATNPLPEEFHLTRDVRSQDPNPDGSMWSPVVSMAPPICPAHPPNPPPHICQYCVARDGRLHPGERMS
ncbi:unnamed protein product [Calicophoron daubneyi]|uniref:FERM domain-containing protein n=1 Tax=Calicophoron daubneyi TaxID=300641 RepID=A0AAV2TGV2_CALDB